MSPADGGPSPLPDQGLGAALDAVGDRWALLVVHSLMAGPRRFSDLADELGVAPNVLTQRLRRLESHGLVVSRPYTERPVRVVYELTSTGRDLEPVLGLLAHWGRGHRPQGDTGPGDGHRHLACGTDLEPRWFCPTCARVVDPDEEPHYL